MFYPALAISALLSGILLIILLISLRLFLHVVDIPNKLGKRLGLQDFFRRALYRVVDKKEVRYFRDEYMEVLHPKIEYREGIERWGLERQMDIHRERAIQDLRKGEQFIALTGGFTALIAGYGFGLALGALTISIAILIFSLIVGFRVIVVDILAYSSLHNRPASIRELAKMKTWNEGPLRGRSGVGVVIASIITSRGSIGQELGFKIMDDLSVLYIDYDDERWRNKDDRE